ncbi:phosphatase PAP2 family protein [Cereibacter sphaeroides]|uniref:phosphatase PAP2 family protein n=1 Tax=Cereibacter sphaeroides TaxID=1063 RepID=UPI001F315AEB|nr:phosphatase PAP2 family protein [Cereibacter sphaeroides]MCE6953045.1 phosphatase PAP2 family protein [Cereibacter sphaeroides]MCE6961856.1 phosphatase PAP2 family protein [Cereibacter sphaeroides]MCE6970631.1 phosphatase PAP2 family protein [Cereibacter sphaeroides]MCE6975773.1 phosphatase PAP2 family protein [Cereibacter sphaeroides]
MREIIRQSRRLRLARLGSWVERRTVALILAISAAGWAFAELAEAMAEGGAHAFDERVLLWMRNPADPSDPLGPPWFEEFARDATALGGIGLLAFLTFAVAVFLGLTGRWRTMWFVLVATGSGQLCSSFAKRFFDRPRPDLVPHESFVYTASFPSGHAMMAAVTYLTLAALLARSQPLFRVKLFLLVLAVIVTVMVGVSRVYLGVHWPTDVLAGWTAGSAWALGCLLMARWLRRRRIIEPAAGDRNGGG